MKKLAGAVHILIFVFMGLTVLCPAGAWGPYAAAGEEPPPIEYAYPDQSVWTTRKTADGILDNPLLHVAEVLFSRLGIRWSASPYPAARMFKRLELGHSNFSMLVKAPRLADSCLLSSTPVVYTELRVYRKKSSERISSKADLGGKSVIVILGYSYGSLGRFVRDRRNNVRIHEARTHRAAFKMLARDRAEYLLDYTGPSEEIISADRSLDIVGDVLEQLDVYLVLSKRYPDAEQVMAAMEAVAATIDVSRWGLQKANAPSD